MNGIAALDRSIVAQALAVAALCAFDLWIISRMTHSLAILGTLFFIVTPLAAIILFHMRSETPRWRGADAAQDRTHP